MSLDIITFGCRLNAYESEVIRANARDAGLDDAVIVNTCAVTAEAERQARQAIRRARRERPDARIVVTGCAAQIDPARYAAMDEVDQVIGNAEKLLPERVRAAGPAPGRRHHDGSRDGRASGRRVRATARAAFVEIQQGCDHRCTFCIIPFGRGNNRSVPIGAIVERVRAPGRRAA